MLIKQFKMSVIAVNKKGQKQSFSDMAWRMLGKADPEGYKNGWKEVNQQVVTNTVNQIPTGEKEEPVSNTANTEPEQTVSNANSKGKTEADKAEFMAAIAGLSPSIMKDFLDKKNVKYKKKSSSEELAGLMAENLNYDVTALQKSLEE